MSRNASRNLRSSVSRGSSQRNTGRARRMQRMRRRRILHTVWLTCLLVVVVAAIAGCVWLLKERKGSGLEKPFDVAVEFPVTGLNSDSQKAEGFAQSLCVGEDGIPMDGVELLDTQSGALFDLDHNRILFSQNMYQRLYPASMTKIMTALLALEQGNMDQIVTISDSAVNLEAGSQVCGFVAGDQVSLGNLINCLLVYSGNDAAAAIAETIGGSQDNFVSMMNQRAAALGMTGTHFTNPHGLQDEQHYTTAYDIYLMLNEAMKNQDFLSMIQLGTYTANFKGEDGTAKSVTLIATDHYLTGEATAPKGVTVLGGKTGTTGMAGNCLALISQNAYGSPFISIISNAATKELLYQQMNTLLTNIN